MKEIIENITILQKKINELQVENMLLKTILDEANIDYLSKLKKLNNLDAHIEKQNSDIIKININEKTANLFYSKFWGRQDVYAKRYLNKKTGKSGYYPQCKNFWKNGCNKINGGTCKNCIQKSYKTLSIENIIEHLQGNSKECNDVIGIYPLFANSTSRLLVFDFDNHNNNDDNQWKEEIDSLRQICIINGIDPLVERSRSGNGAHVWIFFDKPISANLIRKFAFALLEKGTEQINLKSYKYYDRILPNQDYVDDNGLGNLIALPLQGQAVKMGNSVFVDEEWNAYEDQIQILLTKPKLSKEFVEEKIKEWNSNNNFGFKNDKNGLEPWKPISINKSDILGTLSIILSNGIYIDTINITPKFQNIIRRLAAFSNPIYYKNKAIGLSNYKTERIIYLGHDHYNGYIEIPRGLLEQLVKLCEKENIQYNIIDERVKGNNIDITFNGELYDEQEEGLDKISKFDNGILNATTAYGKTVVCSALIAKKKVSTLILLESSTLINQWKDALEKFIDIKSELPTYVTKTGIVKKRKDLIGILHGQKNTLNGIIDIAMVGSIYKHGKFIDEIDKYGMVIVDECHHAASNTMLKVIERIKSKYVYGVTATQIRSDQLERINTMIIGPIRYKYSAKERNELMCVEHYIYPRFTSAVLKRGYESRVHPNEAYKAIISNENRNNLIIKDIQECIKSGRTPVILSKYKEHCEKLYEKIKNYAQHVVLLTGNNSKKDNKNIINSLKSINKEESVIVIGTGSMIGEGFDYPRLDTLIMATPISFRGLVEQYAGRLNRDYDRKDKIIIYDYVDAHINMFSNMYNKRLKAYKQMGYQLFSADNSNIIESNFIFESIDFWDKIIEDIKNANESILISSPYISSERISSLIKIIVGMVSKNIKLTVLTLTPDSYLFGDSSYWMQLQDDLRKVGANVELSSEIYEKYAIIDNVIVWYGNINILGKDKSDENIMRIIDRSIATELEYKSFNKNKQLTEI